MINPAKNNNIDAPPDVPGLVSFMKIFALDSNLKAVVFPCYSLFSAAVVALTMASRRSPFSKMSAVTYMR